MGGNFLHRGNAYDNAVAIVMTTTGVQVPGGGETFSRELHPLFNPVITTKLFQFLSLNELAPCRVVCRTWYDLTLSTWRSRVTLKIGYMDTDSGDGYPHLINDPKKNGTSFSSLLDCWESDYSSTPFRQVHVIGWTLGENGNMTCQDNCNRFWEMVGPHLRKLTLESCNSIDADDFFQVITGQCPHLEALCLSNSRVTESIEKYFERLMGGALFTYRVPTRGVHRNLRSLHLCYPYTRKYHLNEVMSITYLELLSSFPHLTFIQLDSGNPDIESMNVLWALKVLRAQAGLEHACPSLKLGTQLPVGLPLGHEQDQMCSEEIRKHNILNLRVTLETLCVADMGCSNRIEEVVQLNGNTLTTLIASMVHPLDHRCKFPFGVQLDNLKLLTMSEDFCESFEFIKYTPNLKRLFIDDASNADRGVLPRRLPRMSSLVAYSPMTELANVRLLKLTTFQMQCTVSESDLKCLINWFPNVKELEMYLDDSQFAMVCQNWEHLVRLEVYGDDLTDEGVTGLKFPKGTPQSKKFPLTDQPPRANIASLKSLTEFSFIGARLTELSVFHGFLKTGSLRKIVFGKHFRKCMLGERAKNELDSQHIKLEDYSISKAKYHFYDLQTAFANNNALHYWELVKLR